MSERACALCGTPCRAPFSAPPAETSPDLDLRPGEPTRSTLGRWVQTCRGCRACAPDLVRLAPGARAVVDAADYKALSGPARALLRWAMIAETTLDADEAGQAMLEAAWALDDAGLDATQVRRRAAALWGTPMTRQDALRLVDVLRRAGEFDAAGARAAQIAAEMAARPGLDETDAAILRYQLDRIGAGDAGRHLLSSALRPPAQRPHVTQNAAPKGPKPRGLWQRLTGG